MVFDHSKLKGRIIEKFGSQREFVKAFGGSYQSYLNKMKNITRFSIEDMIRAAELLEIPTEEMHEYFFTIKVSNIDT